MNNYTPPFTITPKILNLVSSITEIVTKLEILEPKSISPTLKKANKIKINYNNVPLNVSKNVLLKREKQIIELIQQNPKITLSKIASICNVSEKTIQRDIAKLKKSAKIKRVGSFKSGYWEIL